MALLEVLELRHRVHIGVDRRQILESREGRLLERSERRPHLLIYERWICETYTP